MNARTILIGMVAAAGLFAMPDRAQAAESQAWTYYSVVTQTHVFGKALTETFKRIDERTNGALQIAFVSYGETPHKSTDALQVLKDGLVEMTEWIPAYTTGTYPILGAPGLPFLLPKYSDTATTQAGADRAWAAPTMKSALDAIHAEHGAKEVSSYYYEPMNFYFTKAVSKLDGFRGQRIRIFSPELATLVEELGGTPVSLPAPEVYGALQRGLLDGVVTSSGGVTGLKWSEQLKSRYMVNMLMVKTSILVRQDALDALSPETRAVLEEEMATLGGELRRLLTESDKKNYETMKEMGFSVASSEGDAYQKLRSLSETKIWPAWAERVGPDGKAVLTEIQDIFASN